MFQVVLLELRDTNNKNTSELCLSHLLFIHGRKRLKSINRLNSDDIQIGNILETPYAYVQVFVVISVL